MSNENKQAVKSGKKVRRFAFSIVAVLMLSLTSAVSVRATVPIPLGWTLYYSGLSLPGAPYRGVRVYKKTNSGVTEYVTIVDMRYGTLRSFTGEVKSGPNGPGYSLITRYAATEYWRRAQLQNTVWRNAAVVINGTFFDDTSNPAGIAFGLKSEWWRMSYGYEVGWGTFPNQIKTLAYNPDSATSSIQLHSYSLFDGSWPTVVGGLDVVANKDPNNSAKKRTFVGIRDDNSDGNKETVIFFSSPGATQAWASSVLTQFGATSKMMLDGGTSGSLIVNGQPMYPSSGKVPQAFVIYTGK